MAFWAIWLVWNLLSLMVDIAGLGYDPAFELSHPPDYMTFVSVPKVLTNDTQCLRMKLSVASWLGTDPTTKIILFTTRTEFGEWHGLPQELDVDFGYGRIFYAGSIKSNSEGIPFVDDWFERGVALAKSRYISMINSDILMSSDWYQMIMKILKCESDSFRPVVLSTRTDVDFPSSFYSNLRWNQSHLLNDIDTEMSKLPLEWHNLGGVDVFSFRTWEPPFDLGKFPPFLMGRPRWDGWLIGHANNVSDTIWTRFLPAVYHLNHDRVKPVLRDPTVRYNWNLSKSNGGYRFHPRTSKWIFGRELLCLISGELIFGSR
jgi:hypothetical protein